jgi:NAD kinase
MNRLEGQRSNDDESFISESLSLMSLSEDDGDSASTKALNEISVRRGSYLGLFTEDMEC